MGQHIRSTQSRVGHGPILGGWYMGGIIERVAPGNSWIISLQRLRPHCGVRGYGLESQRAGLQLTLALQ